MTTTHPTPTKLIEVSAIRPGSGSVIATCHLKLGGILIRNVSLRRGRNHATYVNFPSYKNEHGRWVRFVELLSPKLESLVNEAVGKAVAEAVRDE